MQPGGTRSAPANPGPASWIIQRLGKNHDRSAFSCGVGALNDWLQLRASQFDKRDLARTYVAMRPEENLVRGYYALANHRVTFASLTNELARGLPKMDVPVALLGRLAVDQSGQGRGLGEFLLLDALRRVQHLAKQIGIRAVEVDALTDAARAFYLKYGFMSLKDDPLHLYLPMQVIRKLGLPPLTTF